MTLSHRIDTLQAWALIAATFFGLTLAGIPLAYWRFLIKARQIADQKLELVFAGQYRPLQELIAQGSTDVRLKQTARLAVVSHRHSPEALLRSHGFREVRTLTPVQAETEALRGYDAVILDLDGGIDDSAALSLIESQSLESTLGFTIERKTGTLSRFSTFANSQVTLYNRLLELLKFQEAANDK